MRPDNKPMSDEKLANIIETKLENAIGGNDSAFSSERGDAMEYYLGLPMGNEVEGRSQVISTDVSDTIERAMPALMRIFESSKAVEFDPTGPEDVQIAELASEYCNYVYNRDNNGYINTQTMIKDGLISNLGVLKVFWEETDKFDYIEEQGVSDEEIAMLMMMLDEEIESENVESYEIVEQEEIDLPDMPANPEQVMMGPNGKPMLDEEGEPITVYDLMPTIYNIKIRVKTKEGKVRIEPVPPEELVIDRNGRYIDMMLTGANNIGQRVPKTISDLREMGVPEHILETLSEYDEDLTISSDESQARREFDEGYWQISDGDGDDASRQVWVYEMYMHIDYDGDGITEFRKITAAGADFHIIENEQIDYQPFCVFSPFLLPHRIVGRSLANLVMDLQEIKTTMWRHYLDNAFSALNQSTAINDETVNLDDMLESRPDRIIRVEGDPSGSIMPLPVQWMGDNMLAGMQYMDEIMKDRTGITDAAAGLDANTLANANTGVMAEFVERSQATLDLIARNIAEMAFKPLFMTIVHIVKNYQKDPRMVKLNNDWQQLDPSALPTKMDVLPKVGLGTGNKDRELMSLEKVIAAQEKGMQYGLCSRQNVFNALRDTTELMGLPADKYWELQPPRPQTDEERPETILAKAEIEKNRQDADQDHEEMMHDTIKELQKLALEYQVPLTSLEGYKLIMEQEEKWHFAKKQEKMAEAQQEAAEEAMKAQQQQPPMPQQQMPAGGAQGGPGMPNQPPQGG